MPRRRKYTVSGRKSKRTGNTTLTFKDIVTFNLLGGKKARIPRETKILGGKRRIVGLDDDSIGTGRPFSVIFGRKN